MAQHDMSLDNATGANFRADLNNALLAIASNNSGSSAPSTTYALQFYADTTNNILKLRNAANDGFINLFTLAGGVDVDAASNFNEDVTFTGASANIVFDKSADDLIFNDNAKAVFGTSSDGLEIFHDASDSIINDNGTGSLKLQLGGSTKAEVVSGGLTVTGTLTATTLAGTLSTAAQTNVTSLGTLTGLTLSGDMTFTGASANVTFDKSSNELLFADNAKASFGNNGDLVIRHDSSSSIVEDVGTGPLNIQTNNSNINIKGGSSASDTMAIFKSTEGVELFFNNSKKAETVTGGFTVTGTCTATAFAGDGSALTGITGTATTINNNADNRIITGSGTANTLNAESAVLIDGSGRIQQGSATDNLGAAKLNIVGGGSGINISRNQGAGASNDETLGAIAFHGGLGSQDITTGGAVIQAQADENQTGSTAATRLSILTKPSGTSPGSAPTERFRVSSGGNISLIGGASGGANTQRVTFGNTGDVLDVRTAGTNAANHGMIVFRDGNNTFCGQITSHGTNHTTSYGTSSDYRLKENEVLISDGITRLKQLKPYRFQWKSSGETQDGFFAHEAQTVVPEAIQGEKDEVNSENEPVYQGIDQSKLVPLLTAALQEAIAKIETLETKVAALEAA